MTPSDTTEWKPRETAEDQMLQQYARRVGGRIYVEVPIGGSTLPGRWGKGSGLRRLDAVRQVTNAKAGVFRNGEGRFVQDLRDSPAEVIEVKRALSEGAIGQILAGRLMFEECYGVRPARSIIVCSAAGADPALRWVCEQNEIAVETVPYQSKRSLSSLRRKDTAKNDAILRQHQAQHGGRWLTNFPLGGRCDVWGDAEEVHVDALHLLDGEPAGLEAATAVHDAAWLRGRPVELVEVAPKLVRSSIGRAVAWAMMFEQQFRPKSARSVILRRQGDPALEWVCAKLDVEVERLA